MERFGAAIRSRRWSCHLVLTRTHPFDDAHPANPETCGPLTVPVGQVKNVDYLRLVPGEPPIPRAALEHVDSLFRLARHLTGSDADAEDLVQETFARALGASRQFAAGTNLRAWLFRILRNAHIDTYRRDRRNPVGSNGDDEDASDDNVPKHEPLRSDAELERLRRMVAGDIERALGSLSFDARSLILLDLEGLTETELADVLGLPVGTIKSRLFRARALLRDKLRDYSM
jgi:RNA polymerase sigma-70 factor (ECF subfamily)